MQTGGPVLNVVFGRDQMIVIDEILLSLTDRITSIQKDDSRADTVSYSIVFKTVYDVYLFGHKQGTAAADFLRTGSI